MALLAGLRKLPAERGGDVPVLILTARDTVADRVAGLEAGANDHLVEPFDTVRFEQQQANAYSPVTL